MPLSSQCPILKDGSLISKTINNTANTSIAKVKITIEDVLLLFSLNFCFLTIYLLCSIILTIFNFVFSKSSSDSELHLMYSVSSIVTGTATSSKIIGINILFLFFLLSIKASWSSVLNITLLLDFSSMIAKIISAPAILLFTSVAISVTVSSTNGFEIILAFLISSNSFSAKYILFCKANM